MHLVKYTDLHPTIQRQVKLTFVHWRADPTVTTFDQWAHKHAFYITDKGTLARNIRHCEPAWMADRGRIGYN